MRSKNAYMWAGGSAANSGWQTMGSWTVPAPSATVSTVSAIPSSGTGSSQAFAFQFSDTAGATDISAVSVLFNTSTATTNACSVTYNRAQNTLALLTDSGAQPSGTITPGSGSQQNSQCTLSGSASSASAAGNTLTLNLALTFRSAFTGSKITYLQATGTPGSTGWQQQGTWTVPAAVVVGVNTVSVSPASGSGLQQTFALHYSDGAGASDLSTVWIWFNASTSTTVGSCLAYYSRPSNTLYVINDAGTAWSSTSVGSPVTLSNSQCSVNAVSTSVSSAGTDLVLTLPVTFTSAFSGAKNAYMWAGGSAANSGWQTMGSWTVR